MDTVSVSILVAVITGIFSLIGVLINGRSASQKMEKTLEISQAITQTELKNLTEEVKKHNNFAEKIPAMATKIDNLEIRVTRLEDK